MNLQSELMLINLHLLVNDLLREFGLSASLF